MAKLINFLLTVTIILKEVFAKEEIIFTSEKLHQTLATANPGDLIILGTSNVLLSQNAPNFDCSRNGTAAKPITVSTHLSQAAITGSGGATAFSITGNYWTLKGFKLQNFETGVGVSGAAKGTKIDSMGIFACNVGVEFNGGNELDSSNILTKSLIESRKYGVWIKKGENMEITGNSITAENCAVLAETNSFCGNIHGNNIFGLMDIQGKGFTISGNKLNTKSSTNYEIIS